MAVYNIPGDEVEQTDNNDKGNMDANYSTSR